MGAASSFVPQRMTSHVRPSVVKPGELTLEQLSAWTDILANDKTLHSPFYQPEYFQAVDQVRDDVRVAVIEEYGKPVAFFPFQRPASGFGLPVGGKLNDFQGIIGRIPDSLSFKAILKECGLISWAFDHLPDTQCDLMYACEGSAASPYIDFTNGWTAYQEDRIQARSSIIRETKRKQRKLERDAGTLRFVFHTDDDQVFDQLLQWKSAQRRMTKTFDVLQMQWAREVLDNLRTMQREELRGCLSALYAGDRLIAAHFGLISHQVMHLWFPAYNVDFASYSPGVGLMLKMLEQADSRGITRFDLGKGNERFKQRLANGSINVCHGAITASAWAHYCSSVYAVARDGVKRLPFRGLVRDSKRWLDTWVYR